MDIIIGVPINRKSGYILHHFLQNQEMIKRTTRFPTRIVFSTEDKDFSPFLEECLAQTHLDYSVINFDVEKPQWARDRIWALTQAREKIRHYCIEHDIPVLVFVDSDMTFDPNLINILMKKIHLGYDVIYNCYLLKNGRITFNGFGGTLVKRNIFKDVAFRCYETSDNKYVVD
ncbi:MAG: hypothetical protein NQU46_05745 [Methanolinea sp.]|nr:hypothetical protein [Methanolinea sp.]